MTGNMHTHAHQQQITLVLCSDSLIECLSSSVKLSPTNAQNDDIVRVTLTLKLINDLLHQCRGADFQDKWKCFDRSIELFKANIWPRMKSGVIECSTQLLHCIIGMFSEFYNISNEIVSWINESSEIYDDVTLPGKDQEVGSVGKRHGIISCDMADTITRSTDDRTVEHFDTLEEIIKFHSSVPIYPEFRHNMNRFRMAVELRCRAVPNRDRDKIRDARNQCIDLAREYMRSKKLRKRMLSKGVSEDDLITSALLHANTLKDVREVFEMFCEHHNQPISPRLYILCAKQCITIVHERPKSEKIDYKVVMDAVDEAFGYMDELRRLHNKHFCKSAQGIAESKAIICDGLLYQAMIRLCAVSTLLGDNHDVSSRRRRLRGCIVMLSYTMNVIIPKAVKLLDMDQLFKNLTEFTSSVINVVTHRHLLQDRKPYDNNHPLIISINEKLEELKETSDTMEKQWKNSPPKVILVFTFLKMYCTVMSSMLTC